MIFENILETIGNTPSIRLQNIKINNNNLFVKAEFFNPASSVKDRLAKSIIENAENDKSLKPGQTVVEATSGNTGIGLAMVCATKKYPLVVTMPDSASIERRKLMRFLGAKVILTPASEGGTGAYNLAKKLVIKNNWFFAKQFENSNNPDVHENTTAKEIWAQSNNNIDGLVTGVGTGGTVTGCGDYLKKVNPNCKIYAVEPKKSAVISGGQAGSHAIQGIGAGFIPKVLNSELIDEIIQVDDDEAFYYGRMLAKMEGLLSGISSGAALAATIKIGQREELINKRLIIILPSFGERYLSTAMFDTNSSISIRNDGFL